MKKPIRHIAKKPAVRAAGIRFRRNRLSRAVALALAAGTSMGLHAEAALPTGAQVTSGAATVSRPATNELLVSQTTDKLSMNWQSFDIGTGNRVRFDQPDASSIALNRVLGGDRSEIYGNLSANGQVFLVNPNGVLFGAGAQVDVGGLVASTLDITDRDFLDGKYAFSDPSNRASVINQGALAAKNGGYLALIGNRVSNPGTMQAYLGSVVLGAGGTAQLTLTDSKLIKFEITQGALDALVENGGLIRADGGQVILTAGARDSLLAGMVNNTGIVEAHTVERRPGNILLFAGMEAGTTNVGGTLDASAPNGGDGGFIETSGALVKVANSARVTTAAPDGGTGRWLIDPQDYTIAASNGDITGAALSAALAGSNIEIQSSGGGTAGNGDVNVNDAISWSANELTLTAARDINISAVMSATGTSSLVMNTATANGADGSVAGGTVKAGLDPVTGFTGHVDFDRSGTGFLTINGNAYTVIDSVGAEGSTTALDLQGMSGDLSGFYALGADIDASATSGWDGGQGFAPVGTFTGVFDGLGHTISNLTINRTTDQTGLFGRVDSAILRNIGIGGTVNGGFTVGGLLGLGTDSTLHNIFSTVAVSGGEGGGVAGNLANSTVTDVHATGNVAKLTGSANVRGGLIGASTSNVLNRVSASGNLLGASNDLGGLIGQSSLDTITNATASGSISQAGTRSGGLIGSATGTMIADSHATGDISGVTTTLGGGLVGQTVGGSLTSVYATGDVSGISDIGGLVGGNSATVDDAYATGAVTSASGDRVGGLIGDNTGALAGVRAEGDVSGVNRIGGLVGNNTGAAIDGASALGSTVTGSGDYVGGLVGYNDGGAITGSGTTPVSAQANVTGAKSWVGGALGYNHAADLTYVSASGAVSSTASVSDGLYIGGLVGELAGGTVDHGMASGAVQGRANLGGLVGRLGTDPVANNILSSSASGNVTLVNGPSVGFAGGLVGLVNDAQQIRDVEATGTVDGGAAAVAGGLIGRLAAGTVDHGTARGDVMGRTVVGGLVGDNPGGFITDSHAHGNVAASSTGAANAGGLVGQNTGSVIARSYATGNVSAAGSRIGGLVGYSSGSLNEVYAGGNAGGTSDVGGLVGYNDNGLVTDGYATGVVTASVSNAGGLVGTNANSGVITRTYATGAVSAPAGAGGLIGADAGTVTASYWDTTTTGQATSAAGIGLTSAQMKEMATFTGWDIARTGGSSAVWRIYEGNTAPLLRTFLTSVTLTDAPDATLSYNGATQVAGTTANGSVLGAAASGHNTGFYNGYYSTQDGYDITGGNLTIDPASLVLSTSDVTRTYDGTTSAAGTLVAVGGTQIFGTDSVSGGSFGFTDKNAGTGNKTVTVGGATVNDGNGGNNYTVTYVDNTTSTITPASLTVSGITAGDKVYDGTTVADLDTSVGVLSGIIGTDVVSLPLSGVTANFVDKHAGANKTVNLSDVVLNGADAGNYMLTPLTPVTADITPATLTISGITASDKVYDGTVAATVNTSGAIYAGLIGGDDVTVSATGTFNNKNAGAAKTVTLSSSYSGADAGDYVITGQATTTADITPKALTVSGITADNKVYDGTVAATVNTGDVIYSGLINGDDVAVSAGGAFADKNAGTSKTVTLSSSYSGADAGNYIITGQAATTADIMQKALTVSGITASDKVYDGTTVANLDTVAGILSGVIVGDTVSLPLVGVTANFIDKHAGANKTVNLSGVVLNGADAGNYMLTPLTSVTADITPATLTISGITASDKVYDGTVAATVNTGGAIYAGLIGGDDVMVSATGTFSNKNAGAARTVTLASSYGGADAGDYVITGQATTFANITSRPVTVTANDIGKTYGDVYSFTGTEFTAAGLVAGETIGGVSLASAGSVANATVNGGPYVITVSDAAGGSFDSANYTLSYLNGSLTVDRAPLTITANGDGKVFDGIAYSGGNGVTYAGFVNGETSDVLGGALTYGGSAQGAVNVGAYAIAPDGLTADNYAISFIDGVLIITRTIEMQAAITSAQQIDLSFGGFDAPRHQPINFTIVDAGIKLPREEE